MTNEEMIRRYYDGDDSMLEKLYNENIGFIHSIAKEPAVAFNCFHKKEHRPQELTVYTKEILSELDSEGAFAFFDCIQSRKYDATKAKQTTYLYPHIKGAMYRWIKKNVGAISLSKHDMNIIRNVQKMYYEDYKEVAKIAGKLKLSETTVKNISTTTRTACLWRTSQLMILIALLNPIYHKKHQFLRIKVFIKNSALSFWKNSLTS